MRNGFFSAATLVLGFLPLIAGFAAAWGSGDRLNRHAPGELVVKLRDREASPEVNAAVISAVEKRVGKDSVVGIKPFMTDKSLEIVKLRRDSDVGRAIHALRGEPTVAFAEPNLIYHTLEQRPAPDTGRGEGGVPNDPDFAKLWGMHNADHPGADINVLPVWQLGVHGSRKVVVAVVDTGIDWTHPDLAANIWTNPGELAGDGKDNDGNGFVDDVHGWNFANNTPNSLDDHDHGSHCAGTIGGVGNNGAGVAGVNWEVTLMPVKFLDSSGSGTLQGAIDAINYARLMHANIMSNSWGGGGYSEALKQAIQAARDAGILFVAAAGNDSSSNDATASYPAAYPLENVLAVAATDEQDKLAAFSNWGPKTVHVAAPGVNIYSTVKGGKYGTMSGTSMATPHVSGVAALLLSQNPTWTYAEVKERLIRTSDPVQGLRRKVMAHGRIDAYNALKNIVPPNDDPDESLWKSVTKVVESEHPYKDNQELKFEVSVPGARYLRLHFEKIEVEPGYDKVFVETPAGEAIEELTGAMADYTTDYVKGDKLVVRLKSDISNAGYGFKVNFAQVIR